MADIRLRPGVATSDPGDRIRLTDGDITYVYGPRFLSRTALRAHEAAVEARSAYTEQYRTREKPADRERERYVRLTCDVIRSLLSTTSDDTPDAGDLLYEGWARKDTVTEDQIVGLFLELIGVDLDAIERGEAGANSPS